MCAVDQIYTVGEEEGEEEAGEEEESLEGSRCPVGPW